MKLSITVNGERREADGVWEGQSLLNALRDDLDLPGSKNACEQGECGSCSVYLDGTLVCSCLVLAAQADGRNVTTVEGIADGENLHAVQQAMVDAGAVQCGFCTPGFVVASHDLLSRNPVADRARDPRGAGRQPVPLHGLREDHRRGQGRVADLTIVKARGMSAPTLPRPRRPAPRPHRRDHHAHRRRAEGPRRVRVLERHARRRDAVGRDAAQPASARRHLVDRYERGGRDARRARRAHPRRRPRPQDLRDGDRGPARAGLEDHPLPGRGDRDRRRRRSRDRAPRREGDQGRIRACCRR